MFLCTDRLVEGLLKKEGKRKAATLMYQKIKMSENNSIENEYKDNGVFDGLCVVTSAGIEDKLFMATAIDSIGHRSIDANKVQPPQLTNESEKNIKHNINCLSTTMTTLIDREGKLTGNDNSTCTEENVGKLDNKLAVHNELIAVQVQDQTKTVKTNKYIKKIRLIINRKRGMYLFRQKSDSLIYAQPYITKNEKGMIPVFTKIYFCDKTFGNHVQL
jgi:hypothetical protein